ncbi:MAG: type II toxin-antitoxin system PemK/MazF family toxin [Oscillochloridaceae bacterium]|nr:type II toxin-antitoxin system PemK/MazF family toxin [Chloroflexaceae bacterium]MDW8389033.1 type II toxin-antitoxin system PemK/MazF family toxin [Oscillochloridaceae bacterium]
MGLEPSRGEIWLANLNPVRGHEQAGTRPVLIISTDLFNHGPSGLVFVIPLTRTDRRIPAHIALDPPEGGVSTRSFILCDALRSISKDRLQGKPWGAITPVTMRRVEDTLRILLEL